MSLLPHVTIKHVVGVGGVSSININSPQQQSHGNDDYSQLDTLVGEYLVFRGYKQSSQHFGQERQFPHRSLSYSDSRAITERIMSSLSGGDYPRALVLWDTYVVQFLPGRSVAINTDARTAEFILNLYLAVFPFRSEVIKSAGTPKIASATAARSMTIFKHFVETRGTRLVQKDQEFAAYGGLHRIAFPPTHPQYKHLFTEDWMRTARYRISSFLERFFGVPEPPFLCHIFQNHEGRSDAEELKISYQKREKKLIKFSKSLYELTNDLVQAMENGKAVEKDFLANFR